MEPVENVSPEVPPVQSPQSALHTIFIGPNGLRAGWRFVIYVAAFLGLLIPLTYVTAPLLHLSHGKPSLWGFLISEIESVFAAVTPALVFAHFERRPFGDYGMPVGGAFRKNFWVGAVWGIAAITCLLLMLRAAGAFYFGGLELHGARALKFAAFWGLLFVFVGLFEEFLVRGYSQFTLGWGIGFWPAAILLSATFGLIHLPQELALGNTVGAYFGILGAALIGLFFCLTLRRTGNLWFAVGMHAAWDWGETYLYSVPDSGLVAPGHLMKSSFQGSRWLTGGSVGPEGSVLLFVVIAVLWIAFDRVYPAKPSPAGLPARAEVQGAV